MRVNRTLIIGTAGVCAVLGGVALVPGSSVAAPGRHAGSASARSSRSAGYRITGAVASNAAVSLDVALPLRHRKELNRLTRQQTEPASTHYHHWLNPNQFRRRFGATNVELRSLGRHLGRRGLEVTPAGAQSVRVTGSPAAVNAAFSTRLEMVQSAAGSAAHVAAVTPLIAPKAVRALGGRVIDVTPTIRMRTESRRVAAPQPANRYGVYGGYWFEDLKQAYQFPAYGTPASKEANGAGQSIGIVMGSAPSYPDAREYFAHEHQPLPDITVDKIDGGAAFSLQNPDSFEVDLDVQQAGGMAPKAHLIVYDIPDLEDSSVYDAYTAAIDQNRVSVVSSSFGECELEYTPAYNDGTSFEGTLRAQHNLYLQGAAQGITFIASSGDSGGKQCPQPSYTQGGPGGHFVVGGSTPATDPEVTGVGGTNLATNYTKGSLSSTYQSENADADTEIPYDPFGVGLNVSGGFWGSGSGPSSVFAEPSYQRADTSNRSGKRETPDVSLEMGGCPGGISLRCNTEDSFDYEVYGGQYYGAIGTSESAPDFAGVMALYDQVNGRSGAINPTLYRLGAAQTHGTLGYPVFHRNIPGNNGYFYTSFSNSNGTATGYDEAIGNGTLIAKNFIFGSADTPAAGVPESPSNP